MIRLIIVCCLIIYDGCIFSEVKDNADSENLETIDKDPMTSILNNISIDFLMGKFDPSSHKDFAEIPTEYADRPGLFLHKETLQAFIDMYNSAKKDGIDLQIRSATRNFDYQKNIWERKWTGKTLLSDGRNLALEVNDPVEKSLAILKYSSMPGTSRHHWGTDIDLNSFNNSWFESGQGLKTYQWLLQNAALYGYCQPYTKRGPERPHGYEEEKWHWSYTPLSKTFTHAAGLKMEDKLITGFLGAQTATKIHVVQKYILGINKNCR